MDKTPACDHVLKNSLTIGAFCGSAVLLLILKICHANSIIHIC